MNKNHKRWTGFLIILLVPIVVLAFRPASGPAGEPPKDEAIGEHDGGSRPPEGMSEMFQGTVAEVIRAGRHIYVRVDSGKRQVWVAVPAFNGKPGDGVLVPAGVQVANFQSKQLNRKFELIIFVGSIRRAGE